MKRVAAFAAALFCGLRLTGKTFAVPPFGFHRPPEPSEPVPDTPDDTGTVETNLAETDPAETDPAETSAEIGGFGEDVGGYNVTRCLYIDQVSEILYYDRDYPELKNTFVVGNQKSNGRI